MEANVANPVMSDLELAQLGPDLAYIRALVPEKAREMFPSYAEDMPEVPTLFLLCATTGEPLALSETFRAAQGHANDGELCVVPLH